VDNAGQNGRIAAGLERLYRRHAAGIKFGLEVERALLERLGNPQEDYAVIHVAGTNGKGSVCALLDSVLRARGLKVGLYTSPHLVRFNERIRVDGGSIDDESLAARIAHPARACAVGAAGAAGREPTFFECATAMALDHFRRRKVHVAVLETGMGGRLDATNVTPALLAVITRIDVDHVAYLGPDVETIAAEKCGIIRRGVPVVRGAMGEAAAGVVARSAREKGAALVESERVAVRLVSANLRGQKLGVESEAGSYGTMLLPLLGEHQMENLATAVAAIEAAGEAFGVEFSAECVRAGVESVRWPARFQVLCEDPPVILDGGHNPGAAAALSKALRKTLGRKPVGLVAGMCSDKDRRGFLAAFGRQVRRLWAVPIESDRCTPPEELVAIGKAMGWEATTASVGEALAAAQAWARECGGAVCVAGSLFLAGQVLRERGEVF
jgi:dihydrofolate synthase/folylpolyglutamate synthase